MQIECRALAQRRRSRDTLMNIRVGSTVNPLIAKVSAVNVDCHFSIKMHFIVLHICLWHVSPGKDGRAVVESPR